MQEDKKFKWQPFNSGLERVLWGFFKKVVVADSRNFPGAPEFMRSHGIEVIDLDVPEAVEIMGRFVKDRPELWNEDIGV